MQKVLTNYISGFSAVADRRFQWLTARCQYSWRFPPQIPIIAVSSVSACILQPRHKRNTAGITKVNKL